ncbi:MAG: response regulator transcription factor [Candidatus Hydrothermarchaeales archaeon]
MPRVLVVDDEDDLITIVTAILRSEGFEVLSANRGEIALEILESENVDLILLDVMMPEMDGWTVASEIKNRGLALGTPIAMLTVKSMTPANFYSNEIEGITDYINKPFSKEQLLARVKSILDDAEKIKSSRENLHDTSPNFGAEYADLLRTERLYENLKKSMKLSLSKLDKSSEEYKMISDTFDYCGLLLLRIKEKKEGFEKLIEQNK